MPKLNYVTKLELPRELIIEPAVAGENRKRSIYILHSFFGSVIFLIASLLRHYFQIQIHNGDIITNNKLIFRYIDSFYVHLTTFYTVVQVGVK